MALITADLTIPPVAALFPATRRWKAVRPCGTGAAYRRHYRRGEPVDRRCARWHAADIRLRRAIAALAAMEGEARAIERARGQDRQRQQGRYRDRRRAA